MPLPDRKTRGLSDLPGVQRGKQSGVDEQGLRIAYQLGNDLPPQRLHSKRLSFLTRRCNEEG